MRLKFLFLAFIIFFYSHNAFALDVIKQKIPDSKLVGKGTLSKLIWEVYDAKLYAPAGKVSKSKPFALSIHYFLDIDGKDIAKRSIEEMKKQGATDKYLLEKWHKEMQEIFPDVQEGTVLTAIFIPGKYTEFFLSNKSIGIIKGGEFLERFSDIWLDEKTSEPGLRRKLLGLS